MKDNYCVIMGGGIGSRFWPFSRESYPKQFLDFFGNGRSLLQATVDRFAKAVPFENIYMVTNERYAGLIKKQLPKLDESQILLEPCRLNTAPCIAYASYRIRAVNPNANIVVAPSDHLIDKEEVFLQDVQNGLNLVGKYPVLVTLGIRPTRPETGYGYIQSDGAALDGFTRVKTFTEKPDAEMAKVFYESGEFFWNSGIFFWNVNTILKAFSRYLPDITARFDTGLDKFNTPDEAAFIQENFPYCPNISIDYGIMEKADDVYMLCVNFGWSDLGTWGSLYENGRVVKDKSGNAVLRKGKVLTYESAGNIVSLKNSDRLVVLQGLNDYIIAESDNVLLVCKKGEEQRIKQFVTDALMKYGKDFN